MKAESPSIAGVFGLSNWGSAKVTSGSPGCDDQSVFPRPFGSWAVVVLVVEPASPPSNVLVVPSSGLVLGATAANALEAVASTSANANAHSTRQREREILLGFISTT